MFSPKSWEPHTFQDIFYAFKLDTLCSDPQSYWESAMIINSSPYTLKALRQIWKLKRAILWTMDYRDMPPPAEIVNKYVNFNLLS